MALAGLGLAPLRMGHLAFSGSASCCRQHLGGAGSGGVGSPENLRGGWLRSGGLGACWWGALEAGAPLFRGGALVACLGPKLVGVPQLGPGVR